MRAVLIFSIAFLASSWAMVIPENPEALRMVSRGMNQFSKEFYKKNMKGMAENFVMSPIGISMVTAMASFGAGGDTKNQMRKSLAMPEDETMAKSGIKSLIDQSNDIKGVELKMANKIFTTTGVDMKPEFKEVTEKTFDSIAQSMDFTKPEAAETINTWAAEMTNNKIQNLMKPDDIKDASMVLANAVYFKGKWAKPFAKEMTTTKPFNLNEKTTKDVMMMSKMDRMLYGEIPSINSKFIEIPYERSEESPGMRVNMYLIVPNELNDGLRNLENKIESLDLETARGHVGMRDVMLQMPKFKMESTTDLKPAMEEMGMTDMFSDKADFKGITDAPPLKIGKAMQKAMIDVNEEGSEAAAVTSMVAVPMSMPMPPEDPVIMTVDRPFYFAIIMVNDQLEGGVSKSVLFSGRIANPEY
ncbi:leukocyte elastase inhibitor [Fopius arisanus]|uniref:Leukocyte elastase inhibitor n=2 Tax=Fopius arisanus TaxID=64838 RepID=A0A9R1TRT1_9HYME|nr:PREDICTED: leukocyte elastase inhibitor-like [Fopius arisanus]